MGYLRTTKSHHTKRCRSLSLELQQADMLMFTLHTSEGVCHVKSQDRSMHYEAITERNSMALGFGQYHNRASVYPELR